MDHRESIPKHQTDPSRQLANELLPATLWNAGRLGFYQRLWAGAGDYVRTVSDLPHLPLLTKERANELFATFRYDEVPAVLLHTSGTSGNITIRCRSAVEIAALTAVKKRAPNFLENGLQPLVLVVDCANHGRMVEHTAGTFGLKAVGFDLDVINHVIQQLHKTYSFPGYTSSIHVIHASSAFIKMLTIELLRRGDCPRNFGVALLSTFGEYVSPRWSSWIENEWRARHVDNYGMSEAIGGARRCAHCGWFVFDPESWPETVSLDFSGCLSQATGLLALTELYPFSQLQPLVRFLPGDLIEEGVSSCPREHGRVFRLLGRLDRALLGEGGGPPRVLLYPSEIADVIEEFPDLERAQIFHRIPLDAWSRGLGAPLATTKLIVNGGRNQIQITVCPRFSISCFPEAASGLKSRIQSALFEKCRGLAEISNRGLYDLAVLLEQDPTALAPYQAS